MIIENDAEAIAFYGIPYCDPETVKNSTGEDVSTYDEAHTFLVNRILESKQSRAQTVLISHCFIDGAKESDSERPLSIGGADRVSYQPCAVFNTDNMNYDQQQITDETLGKPISAGLKCINQRCRVGR